MHHHGEVSCMNLENKLNVGCDGSSICSALNHFLAGLKPADVWSFTVTSCHITVLREAAAKSPFFFLKPELCLIVLSVQDEV